MSLQTGLIGETEKDKIAVFTKKCLIASLGPQSYSLIKATIAPKTMTAASYKELTKSFQSMAPETSAISEILSFYRILRDEFICGRRNEKMKLLPDGTKIFSLVP